MYGKTEVMDETCSSTFHRKLKQNFNIFVPKIRAKSFWLTEFIEVATFE